MRTAPPGVQKLIEPAVQSLGYNLLGVEYLPQGKGAVLRVYIDHEDGINVHDCEKVSHQISGLLDVEDIIRGHYNLEVSSPGLDRPLFTEDQFNQFIGNEVKIRLSVPIDGRRNFQGVLCGVDGGNVILDLQGLEVNLPINTIERANLVPNF